MRRPHGFLIVALVGALGGAACSRASDDRGKSAEANVEAFKASLEAERAEFTGIPDAVPDVARQLAVEFPKHPPSDRDIALLVAAARVGFSTETFDVAVASTPASGVAPDQSTLAALGKFTTAYKRLHDIPGGESQHDDAARLATLLPTIVAARERGLALDRINLLSESTRNDPEVGERARAIGPWLRWVRADDLFARQHRPRR